MGAAARSKTHSLRISDFKWNTYLERLTGLSSESDVVPVFMRKEPKRLGPRPEGSAHGYAWKLSLLQSGDLNRFWVGFENGTDHTISINKITCTNAKSIMRSILRGS
jgi:hypothetical protein